jgi:hypothetical protein
MTLNCKDNLFFESYADKIEHGFEINRKGSQTEGNQESEQR